MIQNISPENPVGLVDDKKPPTKSNPQKDKVDVHGNSRAACAIKAHQFVRMRRVDRDLKLGYSVLWKQRHISPGIQQHRNVCKDSARRWIPNLDRAYGRRRAEPSDLISWHREER